jgi:hypothetical protein
LYKRQIDDLVSLAQEALHSIKMHKIPSFVLKIDLSKAYDKVKWTFLRLALIKLGMNLITVNWIMGCIESVSFTILINGSPFKFFHSSRGLHKGCPLSPFLFLIVAEDLSRLIQDD